VTKLHNHNPNVPFEIRHNSGSFVPTPAGAHLDPDQGGPVTLPPIPVADRSNEAGRTVPKTEAV
jgi:hypothetical protein